MHVFHISSIAKLIEDLFSHVYYLQEVKFSFIFSDIFQKVSFFSLPKCKDINLASLFPLNM